MPGVVSRRRVRYFSVHCYIFLEMAPVVPPSIDFVSLRDGTRAGSVRT